MDDQNLLLKLALRRRRTSLVDTTLLKKSGARRGTFSAAMDQFEELMRSAAAVGPATRAIALYYALCQAGLAITATHKEGTFTFSKHGLKMVGYGKTIADASVRADVDDTLGAFQAVADSTGSPRMTGPVRVGALWASLPEFQEASLMPGSDDPGAITMGMTPPNRAYVVVQGEPPGTESYIPKLRELFAKYPGTAGWEAVPDTYRVGNKRRWSADITWPEGRRGEESSKDFIRRVAVEYRHVDDFFLMPCLESGQPTPSPLMTWWALLYSFSMFSRYQPLEWTKFLDVNKSESAAVLEYTLEIALRAVPHLVAEALDAKPLLFRSVLTL